jgi:hypothetical protein
MSSLYMNDSCIKITLHQAKDLVGKIGMLRHNIRVLEIDKEVKDNIFATIEEIVSTLVNSELCKIEKGVYMLKTMWPAIVRALRALVAVGLPMFIANLQANPDPRWALLAPILMGVGKYLRDVYKWEWLPI